MEGGTNETYARLDELFARLAIRWLRQTPGWGMMAAVGALGGSIPIPAGLGSIAGMAGMLVAFGVSVGDATAAVLVYQAISIGVAIIGGAIAYLFLRRNLNHPELRAALGEAP